MEVKKYSKLGNMDYDELEEYVMGGNQCAQDVIDLHAIYIKSLRKNAMLEQENAMLERDNAELQKRLKGIGVIEYLTLEDKYNITLTRLEQVENDYAEERAAHNIHVTELIETEKELNKAVVMLREFIETEGEAKGCHCRNCGRTRKVKKFLAHLKETRI